jgi:HAD superfamily 5'-nucleotidase-like hydrolase
MQAPPLDVRPRLADLLGDVKREIDISLRSRIFCNRNLRMASLEFIGFDMDYTLALYQQERMEELSIRLTLDNLMADYGYPDDILRLSYDPAHAIRGLAVDRKLGNVFKMDRHGYVGRVYHGFHMLDKDERRQHYRRERINASHSRYAWIDTLFALPEAVIYMTLVDYLDRARASVDYSELFDHIRASIDKAHRDDSLKSVIKRDLPAYIIKDPNLADTLHKLRSSGKRLFLLTNSYYPYTEAVMTYLLDGARPAYPSWRQYFDVIIVGGTKPRFFTRREPFLLIDTRTGKPVPGKVEQLSRDRVYQGGNIIDFEKMTGAMGEKVLYIGDHIYGDILRLKKVHVWRTAMVLQELEEESQVGASMQQRVRDLSLLDRRRRNLESEIDYQMLMIKRLQRLLEDVEDGPYAHLRPELEEASRQARKALDSLRVRARLMEEEVEALEDGIERSYNPHWGTIFREGNENSRFGKQVSDYADLYTSRVSNFLSYSPLRYFRSPRRLMPHEL